MPKTSEGRTVNAVIKAKICSDNEYVVSPLPWSVIFKAGKPFATDCPNEGNDMSENKIISKYNLLILKFERKISLFILVISFLLFAEETSWMQHYLNYSLPIIQNINAQNEVNIHNLFFFQGGSLRAEKFSLNLLLKSQNIFRILFCFYFFFLPLISQRKVFKKYFKKYIFLNQVKAL